MVTIQTFRTEFELFKTFQRAVRVHGVVSKHFKVCHRTNAEILICHFPSWFLGHHPLKSVYGTFKRFWTTLFGTTAAVIEKKWLGAHANGGLKREKANRPITTNCEKIGVCVVPQECY